MLPTVVVIAYLNQCQKESAGNSRCKSAEFSPTVVEGSGPRMGGVLFYYLTAQKDKPILLMKRFKSFHTAQHVRIMSLNTAEDG